MVTRVAFCRHCLPDHGGIKQCCDFSVCLSVCPIPQFKTLHLLRYTSTPMELLVQWCAPWWSVAVSTKGRPERAVTGLSAGWADPDVDWLYISINHPQPGVTRASTISPPVRGRSERRPNDPNETNGPPRAESRTIWSTWSYTALKVAETGGHIVLPSSGRHLVAAIVISDDSY